MEPRSSPCGSVKEVLRRSHTDLPARFPNWRRVYTRWRRWARVLAVFAADHGPKTYATCVRVHADGTRARGGYAAQAVDRSRGGLTRKIYLLPSATLCASSSPAASATT